MGEDEVEKSSESEREKGVSRREFLKIAGAGAGAVVAAEMVPGILRGGSEERLAGIMGKPPTEGTTNPLEHNVEVNINPTAANPSNPYKDYPTLNVITPDDTLWEEGAKYAKPALQICNGIAPTIPVVTVDKYGHIQAKKIQSVRVLGTSGFSSLQNALNDMPVLGGAVFVEAGEHTQDAGATWGFGSGGVANWSDLSSLTVVGAGWQSVIKATGAQTMLSRDALIPALGVNYGMVFRDLTLNGNNVATKGLYVKRAHGTLVSGLNVCNVLGVGIDVDESFICKLENCSAQQNDIGCRFQNVANGSLINGGFYSGNRDIGILVDVGTGSDVPRGIHIRDASVEYNRNRGATPMTGTGIKCTGREGLTVDGCWIEGNLLYGIHLSGPTSPSRPTAYFRVTNNIITLNPNPLAYPEDTNRGVGCFMGNAQHGTLFGNWFYHAQFAETVIDVECGEYCAFVEAHMLGEPTIVQHPNSGGNVFWGFDFSSYCKTLSRALDVRGGRLQGDDSFGYVSGKDGLYVTSPDSANWLRVDNSMMQAKGKLCFKDSDLSRLILREMTGTGPPDPGVYGSESGTIVWNSAEKKLYVRDGTTWKSVTLA